MSAASQGLHVFGNPGGSKALFFVRNIGAVSGQKFGAYIEAGDSTSSCLDLVDATNASFLFRMFGDGHGQMGLAGTEFVCNSWFQQAASRKRNTANVTNATASMSNLADLSVSVLAGKKYAFTLTLIAKNSTGSEGLQFDLNGGTATFTSIEFGFAGTPIGAT